MMRDICLKTAAIVLQDITRIKQIIHANVMRILLLAYIIIIVIYHHNYCHSLSIIILSPIIV